VLDKYNTPISDMAKIFCDIEAIDKDRIKNYYYLLADLYGEKDLRHKSIVLTKLKRCIQNLGDRLGEYISLRYGLNDSVFRAFTEIDESLSKQRIRQLICIAFNTLKQQRNKYDIYYRIELLRLRKSIIEKEINYYESIINNETPIHITLSDFNFSLRTIRALKQNEIITLKQLMSLKPNELATMSGLGLKCANEIWLELHEEEIYQYI